MLPFTSTPRLLPSWALTCTPTLHFPAWPFWNLATFQYIPYFSLRSPPHSRPPAAAGMQSSVRGLFPIPGCRLWLLVNARILRDCVDGRNEAETGDPPPSVAVAMQHQLMSLLCSPTGPFKIPNLDHVTSTFYASTFSPAFGPQTRPTSLWGGGERFRNACDSVFLF